MKFWKRYQAWMWVGGTTWLKGRTFFTYWGAKRWLVSKGIDSYKYLILPYGRDVEDFFMYERSF